MVSVNKKSSLQWTLTFLTMIHLWSQLCHNKIISELTTCCLTWVAVHVIFPVGNSLFRLFWLYMNAIIFENTPNAGVLLSYFNSWVVVETQDLAKAAVKIKWQDFSKDIAITMEYNVNIIGSVTKRSRSQAWCDAPGHLLAKRCLHVPCHVHTTWDSPSQHWRCLWS